MNSGLHELPLVLFTVLAQSAVGAIILMAVYLLLQADDPQRQRKVTIFLLLPLILLGLGFAASILHLGSPLRAFNSLNRIGSSALSNEIAAGALFFILTGLYWLLQLLNKMPAILNKLWLLMLIVSGGIFTYVMSSVYLISTVPTWNSAYTPASFLLTALLAGFILGYALLCFAGVEADRLRLVPPILVFALLLAVCLVVFQTTTLAGIQTSVQKAAELAPDYGKMMVIRFILLFGGVGLLFYSRCNKNSLPGFSLCASVIFVVIAELIGRTLFYGLHMTVGTTIAG
ncbi:DmsC/YnfH family molybdoenzyme membrane anchor subunit [Testudinibacter sp. TR-2022]|uniref:DmsC/YnfH family molybdoenzyme membrane anchor subunit n=1 Tax=Testudinibacter sp. TR-2022 TaxID=2585029 RepID=UPI001118AA95|nr:DmsC/YnfH family molybdoenzyme membrane anchor subunit [Testudinibacter sp. TR-2022]TNH04868.1 dimethylsulfoxide reductase [Pasteurellaceae bacterium Phil11]TNH21060.1 dimethylsulfoxide reductase [Testudinibacter sp. TR-2022]TNH23160.1 dimethylsulfoxide reductase [Testudinibacter sp. TR-2022]